MIRGHGKPTYEERSDRGPSTDSKVDPYNSHKAAHKMLQTRREVRLWSE